MNAHPNLPIPARAAGIGLKPAHYKEALANAHDLEFFEVHAENFMGAGGPPHRWLSAFRRDFPISLHGVCLSIGGREDLDRDHLGRLADLVDRYEPALVSEHLAWSSDGGMHHMDLLPPPLTETSLARVVRHVEQAQAALGRRILIENPSRYVELRGDYIPESEFLNELSRRSGCGILLDINNVVVSAANLHFDAERYLLSIDQTGVEEIHLAGHAIDRLDGVEIRVDNHGSTICDEALSLYRSFINRAGPRPTLVEWDANVPDFCVLAAEARRARDAMRQPVLMANVDDAA